MRLRTDLKVFADPEKASGDVGDEKNGADIPRKACRVPEGWEMGLVWTEMPRRGVSGRYELFLHDRIGWGGESGN